MDHQHTPENTHTPFDTNPAFSDHSSDPSQTSQTTQPSGPPDLGRPIHRQFEPIEPATPEGPSKALIALAGVGVLLVGFGVFRSLTAKPQPKVERPPVRTVWSEQQQLMRDAIETARQAQQLQREHMEQMRREMMAAEYGIDSFDPDGD